MTKLGSVTDVHLVFAYFLSTIFHIILIPLAVVA